MAERNRFSLFGFRLGKKDEEENNLVPVSFTPPAADDGSITVSSSAFLGTTIDQDGTAKNEVELISRYREMSVQPEIESAIEDIVNEAVVQNDEGRNIKLVMDDLDQPEKIKEAIQAEFDNILKLLNFNNMGSDIFRRYYIDGRLFYHVIIDVANPQKGILELRYIDPRKIKKIRELKKSKDPVTGVEIISDVSEYYVYNDRISATSSGTSVTGIKISTDSVINVNSGLMDTRRAMVLSYLHKAIKPLNQLRMIEDASIIYKISRAPQRRIFYIDVGNLPKIKAEQYVRDMMTKYKNKLVYDACLDMNTLIPLLDGRTLPLYEIQKEFEEGKELWVYSCDPKTGKFAPGLVSSAGITAYDQKVMRITFDNGKSVTCTLDHKFPTWNKGKVEAKDLEIGDSMMPYYTRETSIIKGKSEYQQIFNNDTKKWDFTHRLVSRWKDDLGLDNEWTFDEKYLNESKQTVHHKNYSRFDNTPLNLTRMNRDDHFDYHTQHNSLAGKKGGPAGAKVQKELGIGMFGFTPEQRSELGKISGALGGKKSFENKSGIHGLSAEETRKNAINANNILQENLKDEQFHKEFCQSISNGFTKESKEKMSERSKNVPKEHFTRMNKLANESRWNSENSEENRKKHSDKQSIIYPSDIKNYLDDCAKLNYNSKNALQQINSLLDFKNWQLLNKDKKIRNRKILDQFTSKDLNRLCLQNGFSSWEDYKNYTIYNNHKIVNIEYLEETMNVGTLGIDKEEKYHDYHTFAIDAGVYTCNSTGEVRDDRKHMSMLEDFWMPRRSDGSRGTEITTLESSDSFNDMSMVEYFERKLYKSLNVPVTRLNPEQAFNIGRTAEITRDELKFAKFVDKLRNKFSEVFDNALRIQLVLKGICTDQEWTEFKESTFFDFIKDNNFTELKEAELMQQRLGLLAVIDPYVGKYYSKEWIRKNVLRLDDEEIKEMEQQIEKEQGEDFQEQQKQIVMQQQLASMQQPEGQEEQPQETNPQMQQQNPNAPVSPINPYK